MTMIPYGEPGRWGDEAADELKKQLAEARAEIERKDALIEQMRRSLEWALSFPACTCYDHDTSQDQQTCSCGHADRVQRAMAALEAAERGR